MRTGGRAVRRTLVRLPAVPAPLPRARARRQNREPPRAPPRRQPAPGAHATRPGARRGSPRRRSHEGGLPQSGNGAVRRAHRPGRPAASAPAGKSPGLATTAILVLALGMGGCLDRVRLRRGRAATGRCPTRAGSARRRDGDGPGIPALQPVVPGLPRLAVHEHGLEQPRASTGRGDTCWRRRAAARWCRACRSAAASSGRWASSRSSAATSTKRVRRRGGEGRGHHASDLAGAVRRDPVVVGRSVILSGEHAIVGVLPATFQFDPAKAPSSGRRLEPTGGCLARRVPQPPRRRRASSRCDHRRGGRRDVPHRAAARRAVSGLEPGPGRRRRAVR